MPGFTEKEGRHFVSYITGPSHILLGIKFTPEPVEPSLVKFPAQGGCSHGHLDETKIKAAVGEGLASFREEFGGQLHAAEIVYVENDSPRYDLFRYAGYLLAKHLFTGGAFNSAT